MWLEVGRIFWQGGWNGFFLKQKIEVFDECAIEDCVCGS